VSDRWHSRIVVLPDGLMGPKVGHMAIDVRTPFSGAHNLRRRRWFAAVAALTVAPATVGSTSALASANQISGVGIFDVDGSECAGPPAGYSDFVSYPPIVLTGSLEGCWYTKVVSVKDNGAPSGVYLERGREVFVGSLDGGPVGLFETTYVFESKWDPDVSTGSEVHGRCQHPIVRGSGTGGFAGATGRVDFKDIVADGSYVYRGHVGGV
jgi:hypothetical protein